MKKTIFNGEYFLAASTKVPFSTAAASASDVIYICFDLKLGAWVFTNKANESTGLLLDGCSYEPKILRILVGSLQKFQ